VRYQFVKRHTGQFCVAALCRLMKVSRSGYYAWLSRKPSERQRKNQMLLYRIRQFFERSKGTYGSPRILRDLRQEGFCCGKHRVARLMRQAGLRVVLPRRFKGTTDSKHALPVADNLLGQDFTASKADERWAADITYLWTGAGWLYLAVVLDLFLGGSWAGPCKRVCTRNWFWTPFRWRFVSAVPVWACCTTVTGEASTPARRSKTNSLLPGSCAA
jgi:putative transposase